ncbi:MAG: isochorismatase family cysteine hydrolase [Candidatus Bipolaricaulota bacterium]
MTGYADATPQGGKLLRPGRAALLVIDMQQDFVSPDGAMASFGFDVSDVEAMIPALTRLVVAARTAGAEVIHTRMVNDVRLNAPSWTAFWGAPAVTVPGSWGAEFVAPLRPAGGELVVDKYGYGAFHGTNLELILRAAGIDTVVVAGTGPNICGGETLHQAFARGFRVIAVVDCLASFSQRGKAFNRRLKETALYIIAHHYGQVVDSGELIADWEGQG